MSKHLTLEKLNSLISTAIESIKNMFANLLSKHTDKDNKKASLLAYWAKDYTKYITSEENFDSKSLIKYKRGDVLLIEFGFRIGSELGGRHHAVVVDKDNSIYSDTITVVPLSSLKSHYKSNKYTFILRNGLFNLYYNRMEKRIKEIEEQNNKINNNKDSILLEFSNNNINLDELKKFQGILKKESNELDIQLAMLEKHIHALEKLKNGTVMNVGQITTISKMRIVNPKNKKDSLYKVKLSLDDLDILNRHIKNLFIFENNY